MVTEGFVVFNDRTKHIQLSKILSDIRKKHVFRGNHVNTHCELYRHNNEIQLAQAGKYLMKTLSWRKHYRNLSTICLVCLLFGILILVHFTCNYVRSAIIHVEVKWRRKQLEKSRMHRKALSQPSVVSLIQIQEALWYHKKWKTMLSGQDKRTKTSIQKQVRIQK